MLQFKKYSSIENSFDEEFMERVRTEMPKDLRYVVQEKVHGSNTSFLSDGTEVQFAKRTSILEADEKFYDFPELLERYKERVLNLVKDLMNQNPSIKEVSVFGEMFGGLYPHKEVKANRGLTLIQKGVCYSPGHEFYGFDIYIFTDEGGRFLPVADVNELFEKHDIFYAKTLFEGTLEECLQHPNTFQSKISEWLGLPPLEGNVCEGVVIRPIVPMYLRNGDRVLIKNKNEKFAEKKEMKKRVKLFSEPVPYSDALKELITVAEAYITEPRLDNVISHIGEVDMPKDFGRVIGEYSKDALEDFLKEHSGEYAGLEKSEQKLLNKEMNKMSTNLVKKVFDANK